MNLTCLCVCKFKQMCSFDVALLKCFFFVVGKVTRVRCNIQFRVIYINIAHMTPEQVGTSLSFFHSTKSGVIRCPLFLLENRHALVHLDD